MSSLRRRIRRRRKRINLRSVLHCFCRRRLARNSYQQHGRHQSRQLQNPIVEAGATFNGTGVNIRGGQITIDGFHAEGVTNPIDTSQTVARQSTAVMNATGGSACTSFVTLQSTNTPGNFAIFNAVKQGSCTNLVQNGQPSGSNRAADARPKDGWVFFNS